MMQGNWWSRNWDWRRDKQRERQNEKGFTLVELIVVLVILGILAAITVPALLGWIDKARNQDAILECRSVVMAAQGQVAVEYGNGTALDQIEAKLNKDDKEILTTAGVEGTIGSDSIKINGTVISKLEYTTKEPEITVVYDLEGQPVYKIKDSSYTGSTANGHQNSLISGLKDKGWLDSAGTITNALVTSSTDNNKNNSSKVVQDYFWELTGKKEFPTITKQEQSDIVKQVQNSGLKIDEAIIKDAVWKPIVSTEGKVVLVANSDSSKMGLGNANSGIIYYDGEYYAKLNHNGDGITRKYVSDTGFSVETELNDEYKADCWVKLPVTYSKE